MRYLRLKDFRWLSNVVLSNFPKGKAAAHNLRGVSIDSRTIRSGEIYVAIQGEKLDGHNYVQDAVQKGAAAVMITKEKLSRFSTIQVPIIAVDNTLNSLQELANRHRKRFRIPVLGITGTNGKTTTKEMIAWILQKKFNVLKTQGNLNNHIGVPLTILRLTSEHDIAIVEMGSNHPGEIKALCEIATPNMAMITNIGRGHLEYFASIEGVAREKWQLFEAISSRGIIFLNDDDRRLPKFSRRRKSVWRYSLQTKKQVRAFGQFQKLNAEGAGIFTLNNSTKIKLQVPGIHNVRNALAAASVGLYFGLTEKEIARALSNYSAFDKRMQVINSAGLVFINDTYNSNPDSFIPAVETMNHIAANEKKRRFVAMGDMLELGLESETMHQELLMNLLDFDIEGIFTMGKASNNAAELLAEKGFDKVHPCTSHEQLATELKAMAKPGDIVLLKGSRGMQMERVLAFI